MRWFRKQGDQPRLLSLSPLRTETSRNEYTSNDQLEIAKPNSHRSRIGLFRIN